MEKRFPLKRILDSAVAFYRTAKQRLSVEELNELTYVVGHYEDVHDTLPKVYNLLQNYPDLKERFGVFMPPDINLQFQAGAYSVPNNAKNEKGLADKKETQKNNPSIEEMMNMPSSSKETYSNAPPEVSDKFLDKEDLILTNEIDDEFAKSYLNKVMERFDDKPEVYEKFADLLDSAVTYLQGNDSGIEEILLQITELFINHEDLIEEFKAFLLSISSEQSAEKDKAMNMPSSSKETYSNAPPEVSDKFLDKEDLLLTNEIDDEFAKSYLNKVMERFDDKPEVYEKFSELLDSAVTYSLQGNDSGIEEIFLQITELFINHEDLIEEFKAFLLSSSSEESAEKDNTGEMDENLGGISDASPETKNLMNFSSVHDSAVAPVYQYGTFEELRFFDKMKEACGYPEVYDNFLKFLGLYNEGYVTKSKLVEITKYFFGGRPDLYKEFKDILGFNESGENIEIIPLKVINIENKWKKAQNGRDIDFAAGGRNGSSYRALPENYDQPKCSGRTTLCKEVLNDTWVSFPSWSEDSTFVTSCKTESEETLYRFEDTLFELDMAKRDNRYTLHVMEDINRVLNKLTPEDRRRYKLDEKLGGNDGVLQTRAFERIVKSCLEHTRENNLEILNFIESSAGERVHPGVAHYTRYLINGIIKNPGRGVPILLNSLNNKEKELQDMGDRFKQLWTGQLPQLVLKSQDIQGINFRQKDNKSFRPKSILNDMEIVFAESKEDRSFDSLHYKLRFKKMEVFLDAINLILQYLKKLPGILREDRRKVELIIRSFIPDFFSVSFPSEFVEDTKEEDVKPVNIDNISEEKDVQSMSASNMKGSSDQEESIDKNKEKDDSLINGNEVFDKITPLPGTKLPYALFFVNKNWFVFFRQFHLLCDRLTKLLLENRILEDSERNVIQQESTDSSHKSFTVREPGTAYPALIDKLHKLMSGNLDYAQFEEEARSLYKIHAYISYTLDKLILTIVRQVQHILADDLCKDCTGLFLQHTKVLSTGGHSSCLEASQVEYEYFWKAEKLLEDEDKCFKIVWHKEKHILTVEIHEHENNREYPDPHEAEMKSNYFDTYLREDFCYEDILDAVEQLPVILPRNWKKQQIYWKNKVTEIEKLWCKRQSSKGLKKAPPPSLKRRKGFCFESPVLRKRPRTSSAQENNMSLSWKGAASKYNYEPNLNVGTFKTMHEGEQKIGLKVMSDVKIKKKVSGDKTGISTKNVSGKSRYKIPEPQNISIHVEGEKKENKEEECKKKKNDNETFIEIEKKTLEDKEEMKDNVKKAIDKVNKLESSSESLSKESEKMIVDNVADHLKEFGEAEIINPLKESGKEKIDNSADHFKEMNKTTKEIDNLVEQSEDSKRKVEDTEIEEEETKDETGNLIYDPKNETLSKRLKTDAVKKSQDFNEVAIEDVRVETTKMLEEIVTADSYSSATESEHKSDDINISKKVISGEMKKKRALSPEDVSDPKDVEIDLKSRVDMAIEMAHRVMETINYVDQKERNLISDSDSVGKTEELLAKVSDEGPSKRRNTRSSNDYSVVRRKPINQYSVKRRAKKIVQCNKGKRRRQTKPKCEYLDDPTFDFFHLSELPSDEKNKYLAWKHVTIDDNEQVYFKRGGYKFAFVQNHHYYMYRKNTLHRAKEIHQAASEIKTSNFNAWHMAWLDEHVTPTMLKSCNDWLVKNEKDKFTSQRVTVSDCTKPPYIPYNKYKVYYYEAEDEEELSEG